MLDLRPILLTLGSLLMMLAFGMAFPMIADLIAGHDDWTSFAVSAFFCFSMSGLLILANRDSGKTLNARQAFLLTASAWILLPVFAAFPFSVSELGLSFTDAYFEAVSGLTTTGSTVITGLDHAPPGLLLWRAILQWFGGVGIIVMAVAILPLLQIGGMQLFRLESGDTNEKILPRAAQISMAIGGLYLASTSLCSLLLIMAGMESFDAIVHAMTAISTGGFSTKDSSVGYFNSGLIDSILIIFMLLGSLPFVLLLQLLRGRPMAFWRDEQVRGFLGMIAVTVFLVSFWLVVWKGFDPLSALRYGSFNLISVITSTGYASTDYGAWGKFSTTLFFFAMFIGGCTGSTAGGLKIFRFHILFQSIKAWREQIASPRAIIIARYNGQRINEDIRTSVMNFFLFFTACLLLLSFGLALTGLDWLSALSGAGTAMTNVGPGLGDAIGPASNFKDLPSAAKWLLCLGMILGRLDIFPILLLVSPRFWRT